jgi:hypothetical protein
LPRWADCYDRNKGNGKIIPGEKGRLIARAFEMKVEGLTNTEVAAKLHQLGLRLDKKRLSELFRNPSTPQIEPTG